MFGTEELMIRLPSLLLAMGGLGLFFATALALASEKLKVEENPRVVQVSEALPGLNCGA